ncbi:hypothetical protein [Pimelobacter simplex]|uniref:hypothetical protein n=1 Tax=Nocardioides simplex TaxID=2045 RepID=UPI001932B3B9|nr:hypothetical protein [Pimelobacter simplex]
MPNRYFKRRWEETRGDAHDSWGASTWYFEVGADGWPIRQVEVYDDGPTLRYGPGNEDDLYGQLGQVQLDEFEDWEPWAIPSEEFEHRWTATE